LLLMNWNSGTATTQAETGKKQLKLVRVEDFLKEPTHSVPDTTHHIRSILRTSRESVGETQPLREINVHNSSIDDAYLVVLSSNQVPATQTGFNVVETTTDNNQAYDFGSLEDYPVFNQPRNTIEDLMTQEIDRYEVSHRSFSIKVIFYICLNLLIITGICCMSLYIVPISSAIHARFYILFAFLGFSLLVLTLVFCVKKTMDYGWGSLTLFVLFSCSVGCTLAYAQLLFVNHHLFVVLVATPAIMAVGFLAKTWVCNSPGSFTSNLYLSIYLIVLTIGNAILAFSSDDRYVLLWIFLIELGIGTYLSYDIRIIDKNQRNNWEENQFIGCAIGIWADWALIIWAVVSYLSVTYNVSRTSLRMSRTSVNYI